jgi:hypothetical protein
LQVVSDSVRVRLPVATIPTGIPKLASAGYALSPYQPAEDYSSTTPRHRQLWLEVAAQPDDGDGLFARLLAYAPDPLLYSDPTLRVTPPGTPPALALDPELLRVITPGQSRDDDGLEAMIELHPSKDDPLKFLLPLPDGVAEDDPRLFGMWTYELRYGHKKRWSLAHARFSRPLQVTGVQHPAPPLPCIAAWQLRNPPVMAPAGTSAVTTAQKTRWQIAATAPYATPVLADGRRVGMGFPLTTIGFLLYAQAIQADGSTFRNVLLEHRGSTPVNPRQTPQGLLFDYASATFTEDEIGLILADLGFAQDAPLSIIAVEFYAAGGSVAKLASDYNREALSVFAVFDPFDPPNFGKRRILRTSPLTKVEPYC